MENSSRIAVFLAIFCLILSGVTAIGEKIIAAFSTVRKSSATGIATIISVILPMAKIPKFIVAIFFVTGTVIIPTSNALAESTRASRYELVCANPFESLSSSVTSKLRRGWFLYGSPVLGEKNNLVYKCQAVIKAQ